MKGSAPKSWQRLLRGAYACICVEQHCVFNAASASQESARKEFEKGKKTQDAKNMVAAWLVSFLCQRCRVVAPAAEEIMLQSCVQATMEAAARSAAQADLPVFGPSLPPDAGGEGEEEEPGTEDEAASDPPSEPEDVN